MGRVIKDALIAVILAGVIPGVLFKIANKNFLNTVEPCTEKLETSTVVNSQTTANLLGGVDTITVLMRDGSVQVLDMDTYITSVILREMPAEFEFEALKAQAVVARTYAMRQKRIGNKHSAGEVCSDPACCQGYCTVTEYMNNGGQTEAVEKIKQAVLDTKGEVLTYEGELIEATYFSCSGGKTEAAEAVWGSNVPYLQSVISPGEENASHYTDTITISLNMFVEKMGLNNVDTAGNWIGDIVYTSGGGVESIDICGKRFTGVEVRRLLDLRSTSFIITVLGSSVTITTKGFGHRVGMSQYGADAMAVVGNDYRQILSHYYQGTVLQQYQLAD